MPKVERVKIKWSEVNTFCKVVREHFPNLLHQQRVPENVPYTITGVTGLVRGGLPLAVALSHHLNVPYVWSVPAYAKGEAFKPGASLLIVDDICCTGATLYETWKSLLPYQIHPVFVTWFMRDGQAVRDSSWVWRARYFEKREEDKHILVQAPEVYGVRDAGSAWIDFPWETGREPPKARFLSLVSKPN